jgi:hypothetical protein
VPLTVRERFFVIAANLSRSLKVAVQFSTGRVDRISATLGFALSAQKGVPHGWQGNTTDKDGNTDSVIAWQAYPWYCHAIRGQFF